MVEDIPARLQPAMRRLALALDQLEAAGARLGRADAVKTDTADVLALMQDDRARLAGDLDAALARLDAFERATDAVGQRLAQAGTALRRLLADGQA